MYIEIKTKLLNDMCCPMLSPIFANHSPPLFPWPQDKLQRCGGGRSLGGGGKSPGDGPAETCRCGCRGGPHGDTDLSMQTVPPEYGNMTDTCRDRLLESDDQLIWGLDTWLSAKISQAIFEKMFLMFPSWTVEDPLNTARLAGERWWPSPVRWCVVFVNFRGLATRVVVY